MHEHCKCRNSDLTELKFLAGIVLGGIAGIALGILFAPESGEQTRRKLKKEVGKQAKNAASQLKKIEKTTIRPAVNGVKKDAKVQLESLKKDVARKIESKLK